MRDVLFSHPGSPVFAQHAARGLHEAGRLARYVTTFHYRANSGLGRLLRMSLSLSGTAADAHRQLTRREIIGLPDELVAGHPAPELLRMLSVKARFGETVGDRIWEAGELWFDWMVAHERVPGVAAVYGYEYSVLRTFRRHRRFGNRCIYDMPIPHHATVHALLEPEFERFPELRTAYLAHLHKLEPKRNARKDAELQLADHVMCASTFTKESLMKAGIPEARISVIPYGAPSAVGRTRTTTSGAQRQTIFLCAGTQSVRKGVHYLLDAWRQLKPGRGVALWLVGAMELPRRLLSGLPGHVEVRPSVPRSELDQLYDRAAALVFPSLCEGFGMVITEAMARGVPVITTPHTAGRDLIDAGRNGLMVPVRDSEALAGALNWCIEHPTELAEMGNEATRTAAAWQWRDYRSQLADEVIGVVDRSAGNSRSGGLSFEEARTS